MKIDTEKKTPTTLMSNGDFLPMYQQSATYYGQINTSYHKHGVGLYLSKQMSLYVGEFKNNTISGRGCIIFRSGRLLYSSFLKNVPYGLFITVCSNRLICGTLNNKGTNMVGMAYEYDFKMRRWRMYQCQNNIHAMLTTECSTVIAEEDREFERGPPRIMASEPKMYQLTKEFILSFQGLFTFKEMSLVKILDGKYVIGGWKDGNPHGIAAVLNNYDVQLVGQFDHGTENGYILEKKPIIESVGIYHQGFKHGLFEEIQGIEHQTNRIVEYRHGQQKQSTNKDENKGALEKQWKNYIDKSKYYVAVGSLINFREIEQPFVTKPKRTSLKKSVTPMEIMPVRTIMRAEPKFEQQQPISRTNSKASMMVRPQRIDRRADSCLATVKKKMPYLMELMKEQNIEDDHVTMEESPFC